MTIPDNSIAMTNTVCLGFAFIVVTILLWSNRFDSSQNGTKDHFMSSMLVTDMALLGCSIGGFLLEGRAGMAGLDYFMAFGSCGFGHPLAGLYTEYVISHIPDDGFVPKHTKTVIRTIWITALLLVLISTQNHMYFSCEGGIYTRGPHFILNQFFGVLELLPTLILILLNSRCMGRRMALTFLSYPLFPVIAVLIQIQHPFELDYMNMAIALSLVIVYVSIYIERGRQLIKRERELNESRVAIMLSQIQPHFLYNALTVIQDLCHDKAPDAEETTIEFSNFLRENIESLKSDHLVPFERELGHTRNYLSLESKRFGSQLQVIYDIQITDFLIPSLTLQPIVENAVRCGVMQREDGGTVRIASAETPTCYRVTVQDNGVGFDSNIDPQSFTSSIKGISDRLDRLCSGSMLLKSVPGLGSTVIIVIPKET